MPYSRMFSLTRIYPGGTQFHLAIKTKPGHKHSMDQRQSNVRNQQSMSIQEHKHSIDQRQINGRSIPK